ncbi:MAG: sugar phosphate isomerase/epimerase, partial [Planctomycetes bacterium]|nr:sugar phosphate isomerase/epimerase [Planctomycetota bacterium]
MGALKVGCGEWGFRELPMEEHFRIAAELGFQTLEFGVGGGKPGRLSEDPDAAEVAGFLALTEQYGVRAPFCCIENDFTLGDEAAHNGELEKALRQSRIAADCGATHVRLFCGFTPLDSMDDARWERMLDAFGVAESLCSSLGMEIAIETHGAISPLPDGSLGHAETVTTDPEALARLVRELPPAVGFNLDAGNLKAARPADNSYGLNVIAERINYCHMKDWARDGEGWRAVAIGDDDMDWGALLEAIPFDGVHLIEYEPTEDVVDGIRR